MDSSRDPFLMKCSGTQSINIKDATWGGGALSGPNGHDWFRCWERKEALENLHPGRGG